MAMINDMYNFFNSVFSKSILVLMFLLGMPTVVNTHAAKPVELTVDKITYRIVGGEAAVASAERNMGYARILDSVEYQDNVYPVTRIEVKAFYDNLMTTVYIPKTIKSSGQMAFSARVKEVQIDDLEAWFGISFEDQDANPLFNGAKLSLNGDLLKDIVVPDEIRKIKDFAFFGYANLKSLKLHDRVSSIGENAFFNCSNLTSVLFSYNLKSIGGGAFYKSGVKTINLPHSIESLGDGAFSSCADLETVYLGKNIDRIGCRAFAYCESLETVYCYAMTPPVLESQDGLSFLQSYAFMESFPQGMVLHVPEGTKPAYSEADGWNLFGAIIDDLEASTGINEVLNEGNDNVEFFNLQGMRIENPVRGLYI